MIFTACEDYVRALDVTLQWLRTTAVTRDSRHMDTALICSKIAREKFAVLEIAKLQAHEIAEILQVERAAETEAYIEEMRASISECRETLERTCRYPVVLRQAS
jgi:hypothetical protein